MTEAKTEATRESSKWIGATREVRIEAINSSKRWRCRGNTTTINNMTVEAMWKETMVNKIETLILDTNNIKSKTDIKIIEEIYNEENK